MIFKKICDSIIIITVFPMCQVFVEKAKSMKQENMLGFLGTLISSYLAKIIVICMQNVKTNLSCKNYVLTNHVQSKC